MIEIKKINSNFEREPLISAFGFKGGYLSELWQSAVMMESASGCRGTGLGTQSTLWSDAGIFANNSESAGNSLMYLITAHALKLAEGMSFDTPLDLLDKLLPATYDYGKKITCSDSLRLTFALNALVAVDNAAWQLYCIENKIAEFDEMTPLDIKPAMSYRHQRLANIPLMTYGVPLDKIVEAVDDGCCLLKIKIGSDPAGDGDLDKMLQWDKDRLSAIHDALKDRHTPYTESGSVQYYLDANGRYDTKDRLMRLIDHAQKIGALERIALLEEPFAEEKEINVTDIPVRLAADESAHSDTDATERIEMGYKAIALKPIAKTMSMSLKIAKVTYERNIPCFCADLTVNPILVEWNKNVAARLAPLPGMKIGVLESNGKQNYLNWDQMRQYHPCFGASWTDPVSSIFNLDEDFYAKSGGILLPSSHYAGMVN
ncbi:L-alanine-DL-glutamate epimerase [bacterium]|nr:L-alanine-DL-glutamate epimerase [bacterium]